MCRLMWFVVLVALSTPVLFVKGQSVSITTGASLQPAVGLPSALSTDTIGFDFQGAHPGVGKQVVYEVQVRAANGCEEHIGSAEQQAACRAKVAPKQKYRYTGTPCDRSELSRLENIKLGTFDDMLEDTDDYRKGITLRYIKEKVDASVVWVMPAFPNNDRDSIPHPCDNLGSPYAVRDYLHMRGSLSRRCILDNNRDEYDDNPCWANQEFDQFVKQAHKRGLKVWLDLAFNHFGHGYLMYDNTKFTSIAQRTANDENLHDLWDFDATFEQDLLKPKLLERESALSQSSDAAALDELRQKCPGATGQKLVRLFSMWRIAFPWERQDFDCAAETLEDGLPAFYTARDAWNPSPSKHDFFTNNWVDVKFLFLHEKNSAHAWEYFRVREYLFRVMNYWVSHGVDGFRLDHTSDHDSGIGANFWRYITWKVNYYARRRGQARPMYLAEEFHDQGPMAEVVDTMIEGYVFDITGRKGQTKNTPFVERVVSNAYRFQGQSYPMTALETHDEHRLMDGTGFSHWTGAGFWGIGGTMWSMPMLLMGQEFGEPWGLGFRRATYLRGRFEGTSNYKQDGDSLCNFYRRMNKARKDPANTALRSSNTHFLRTRAGSPDDRIFAVMKWSGTNVIFAFHNLWEQDSKNAYYIPPDIAKAAFIRDDMNYHLYDLLGEKHITECKKGSEWKWSIYVEIPADMRLQWMRLEAC